MFLEAYAARSKKVAESTQKLFMKADKLFRRKTDNHGELKKLLVEHKVGPQDQSGRHCEREIGIDTHGGATWEFNALVNLAARES